jgi:hypothetical protein
MEPRPWQLPSLRLYAEDNGFYSLKTEPGSLQAVLMGAMLQCSKVMAPAIDPRTKNENPKNRLRCGSLQLFRVKKDEISAFLNIKRGKLFFTSNDSFPERKNQARAAGANYAQNDTFSSAEAFVWRGPGHGSIHTRVLYK